MPKQELLIKLPSELGHISLSTKKEEDDVTYSENKTKIKDFIKKTQSYNITLYSIPPYTKTDNDTPILYEIDSKIIKRIYLLEETEYILKYTSKNNKLDKKCVFPFIKDMNDIRLDTINNSDFFLNFNSYVGKAFIDIESEEFNLKIPLEIRSKKINYDKEYRKMLEDLAEITSNLTYNITPSPYQTSKLEEHRHSDYDYFLLLTYIFSPENLPTVFEYLSRNLNKTLTSVIKEVPVSFASNVGINEISNILSNPRNIIKTDRYEFIEFEDENYIPLTIHEEKLEDTIDTPENRFYKYFLELVEDIILTLLDRTKEGYIQDQLSTFKEDINYYLSKQYFKKISKLDYIPLNSQILQKKEGYRDILKYYVMLEYGNKFSWDKVNDIVNGHQKRLSEIYEIWECFQLLDIIKDITDPNHKEYEFNNESVMNLIDNENFIIDLKENTQFHPIKYAVDDKEVTITLMYNKHFRRGFKKQHSYSIYLRPDYTIRLEFNDKIRYIHFDAKYKSKVINKEKTIDKTFKNQDIAKMHTYKDAIPNTICAYILYPGKVQNSFTKYKDNKFEGVGAYPLKPGNKEDKDNLKEFIEEIIKYELDKDNQSKPNSDIND